MLNTDVSLLRPLCSKLCRGKGPQFNPEEKTLTKLDRKDKAQMELLCHHMEKTEEAGGCRLVNRVLA